MTESLVLQEFIVSLGFKVDEQTFRKFKETLAVINKEALSLGAALVGVAAAVVTATERTAEQFTKLEFPSQRSDTTVKGLNAIGFAFSQIGINADQARGMVENFATLIRTKSGMAEMLTGLGIPEGAPAERFKSLIGFLTQLDKTNEPLAQQADYINGFSGRGEALGSYAQGSYARGSVIRRNRVRDRR